MAPEPSLNAIIDHSKKQAQLQADIVELASRFDAFTMGMSVTGNSVWASSNRLEGLESEIDKELKELVNLLNVLDFERYEVQEQMGPLKKRVMHVQGAVKTIIENQLAACSEHLGLIEKQKVRLEEARDLLTSSSKLVLFAIGAKLE